MLREGITRSSSFSVELSDVLNLEASEQSRNTHEAAPTTESAMERPIPNPHQTWGLTESRNLRIIRCSWMATIFTDNCFKLELRFVRYLYSHDEITPDVLRHITCFRNSVCQPCGVRAVRSDAVRKKLWRSCIWILVIPFIAFRSNSPSYVDSRTSPRTEIVETCKETFRFRNALHNQL